MGLTMKTINSIEELHEKQFSLIEFFASFCDDNNLEYALAYVTCLGAIRHKDFIPWDDDADIIMPRSDYDKFIELTKTKSIAKNIGVVAFEHDSTYPYSYAKVINCDTVVKENYYKPYILGLFLDIFPLDGLPNNLKDRDKLFRKSQMQQFILYGSFGQYEKRGTGFWDYTLGCIGTFFLHRVYKKIRKYCVSNIIELATSQDYKTSDIIGCPAIIDNNKPEVLQKSKIFPSTTAIFHGKIFKVPQDYDYYLTQIYGDYMKIPPKEQQITHDFKISYK